MRFLSVDGTLGSILIGTILCSFLFGINTIQTFYYARRSKRDFPVLKFAVALIWVLNLLQLIFTFTYLYYYGVTHYMDPPKISHLHWSFVTALTIPAIIYVIVTMIYAWRIYIVSDKSFILAVIPLVLALFSAGFWMSVIELTKMKGYFALLRHATNLYVAYSTAVACDIYIATILSYYLLKGKSGLRMSNSIVNTVILYVVSTGSLSALLHSISLITYATMAQKNIVYIGIYIIIPELYTNALLATLNAREQLRIRSSAPLSLPNLSYTDQTTTALPTPIDQPSIMLHSTAPSFLTSEFRDVSFSTIDPANSASLPWLYSPETEVSDVHPATSPSAMLSEWKSEEKLAL